MGAMGMMILLLLSRLADRWTYITNMRTWDGYAVRIYQIQLLMDIRQTNLSVSPMDDSSDTLIQQADTPVDRDSKKVSKLWRENPQTAQ